MMKIQKFTVNPFLENTYLIWDDKSKDAAVIDPGFYDDGEKNQFTKFVETEKLNLIYLINTHCHIDHIFGNTFVKTIFECKYMAPEQDLFMLDLMIEQAKVYGVTLTPSPKPDELITEDLNIRLGDITGRFIFTPGHSPGEYCLYFENDKVCFTGDVLFKESIGRTDLWGGNYDVLMSSIRNKLMVLPDHVAIYPGHEASSTIGYEKENNPFLRTID